MSACNECSYCAHCQRLIIQPYLCHRSFSHLPHSQRRAFKPTFIKVVSVSVVSNIWKHVRVPAVLTAGGRWRAQTAHRTGGVSYWGWRRRRPAQSRWRRWRPQQPGSGMSASGPGPVESGFDEALEGWSRDCQLVFVSCLDGKELWGIKSVIKTNIKTKRLTYHGSQVKARPFAGFYRHTWRPKTCNVVNVQDFIIIITEAEDEVSICFSFAALRLTVAAVQLHLDLTLTVTFHC